MRKRTIILITFLVLGAAGGGTALLLPRFLVQQATQKPTDAGEFVTAPPPAEVQLQDRISSAIENQPPGITPAYGEKPAQGILTPQQNQPQNATYLPPARAGQEPPPEAGRPDTVAPSAVNQPAGTPLQETPPQLEKPPEGADPGFQVQVSESEIAGLIYNGMIRNIQAPYRPAFKGVSARLRDGRGKITVALDPQHLPAEMLRSLPGVDRQTPVVYMGGEVGLDFDSQTVYPVIHNVSLGNMKIPYAAIKAMIKYEVHRQIASLLQPSSGQQVTLTGVSIADGFLTIKGHVR